METIFIDYILSSRSSGGDRNVNYSREELINYRIERAKVALNEARLLAEGNYWNTVASRLYYCCFYMIMALFQKYEVKSTTHAGAKAQFNKYFIKTNRIALEHGELFTILFNKRQQGDYEDFRQFKKEEIVPLFAKTESFLMDVELLIRKE
jgi:uncharacterized protein (UPF0332 family)